jgi:glutamyl-tRNA reductase
VNPPIAALLAHARSVPAAVRSEFAREVRAARPPGSILLETCHRVELYGSPEGVAGVDPPPGAAVAEGESAARHLVALAVGRASAVLAEDQVLHQLRVAVGEARRGGPLPPALDHLADSALRAGRRARSWLPSGRPTLADVALDLVGARGRALTGPILVVGAGEMGTLAARAAVRRGRRVVVASRTFSRAAALAEAVGGAAAPIDAVPTAEDRPAGVIVALSGAWAMSDEAGGRLLESGALVVDLSSPAAIPAPLVVALGDRFRSIDDLAAPGAGAPSTSLAERLDRQVEATLVEYRGWLARAPERETARELAARSAAAQAAELAALWERMPGLPARERAEVERMARRLAERLLRDPLERLRNDEQGRHRRAARELFGL